MSERKRVGELQEAPSESVSNAPAQEEIVNAADAEFDKELLINLDTGSLTYICDYCGKVNSLKAPRCVRCGKRRPRSEYIKAMNSIRSAEAAKQAYAIEKEMEAEEVREAERTLNEQKEKLLADRREARNLEVVRIVEQRVQDEMTQYRSRTDAMLAEEKERIKKQTAREAALRIIAAERMADDIVEHTKKSAAQKEVELHENIDKLLQEERQKAIDIAASQLVAQRAGIEQVAIERIAKVREECEREASEKIALQRDEAEKMAARRAVVQIIAHEKATEDSAARKIEEEKEKIFREAEAKILAEKQGMERAADERIKSEREMVKRLLEERGKSAEIPGAQTAVAGGIPAQSNQFIQPMVIVPYVNANQPVLQYKPNQVYRFVPNTYSEQQAIAEMSAQNYNVYTKGPEPTVEEAATIKEIKSRQKEEIENEIAKMNEIVGVSKKTPAKKALLRNRILALITLLLSAGAFAFLYFVSLLPKAVINVDNLTVLEGFAVLIQDGINEIFGSSLALFAANPYVTFIRESGLASGIILPLGLAFGLVCMLIVFIRSIVRLISGKAARKGILLPIFNLVFALVAAVGIFMLDKDNFLSNLGDTTYSAAIFAGFALVILVVTLFTSKTPKAPKVKDRK